MAGAQYLTFSLDGTEYAVDILRVSEIRGMGPLTPVPNAPAFIEGVMNLRGAVVPVVDLRVALGLARGEHGKFTVIVILSVRRRTIGFIVDGVREVVTLEGHDIERPPDLAARADASLVAGVARAEDRFVLLVDVDRFVSTAFEEVQGVPATGA